MNDDIQDRWWQGVEEWYNTKDYMAAMELWLQVVRDIERHCDHCITSKECAIDALEHHWGEMYGHDGRVPVVVGTCHDDITAISSTATSATSATSTSNTRQRMRDDTVVVSSTDDTRTNLADFLLFVAGCCLDAQRSQEARRCLGLCLQLTTVKLTSSATINDHPNDTSRPQQRLLHPKNQPNEIRTRALLEYMASYQEEREKNDTAPPPWNIAQRVVALTLRQEGECKRHDDNNLDTTMNTGIRATPWINIYQRPAYWWQTPSTHNLRTTVAHAVIPVDQHPGWCRVLQDHAATIQDEFETLLHLRRGANGVAVPSSCWPRVGAGDHRGGAGDHDGTVVRRLDNGDTSTTSAANGGCGGGDWRELVLFGTGARPDLAPRTAALIRAHCRDDVISLADAGGGEVIFSVLGPHTHIEPHTASHNVRATAHLGLIVPQTKTTTTHHHGTVVVGVSDGAPGVPENACYLRVADQICGWEKGRMLVFDDSFEHEVINSTNEIRGVLLLRFWHPSIPRSERTAALARIQAAQEDDMIRRCNPPIPSLSTRHYSDNGDDRESGHVAAWRARYRNQSVCPSCWQSGYDTIRVQRCGNEHETFDSSTSTSNHKRKQQRRFVCECGVPIAES